MLEDGFLFILFSSMDSTIPGSSDLPNSVVWQVDVHKVVETKSISDLKRPAQRPWLPSTDSARETPRLTTSVSYMHRRTLSLNQISDVFCHQNVISKMCMQRCLSCWRLDITQAVYSCTAELVSVLPTANVWRLVLPGDHTLSAPRADRCHRWRSIASTLTCPTKSPSDRCRGVFGARATSAVLNNLMLFVSSTMAEVPLGWLSTSASARESISQVSLSSK